MDTPEAVFRANLALIDRVTRRVCARARLFGADAEDFASTVRLALMENDYAVLRRYEGRSSLATFLAVVIDHLFYDERNKAYGKWHTSAEAERHGPAGVMLEQLVSRDRRPLPEAIPIIRAAHPELTPKDIEKLAHRLPERIGRPRLVQAEELEELPIATAERADDRVLASDAQRLSDRAAFVLRETMESMTSEDQAIVRFRFGREMSVADISRMMRLPQRPLYRRVEALLERMRTALVKAGIDRREIADLIGGNGKLDLGFGKSHHESPSTVEEPR
ncbi:MAG TPA: sigma-70 family RNA polymerase sigma factor [Thermoanaerobaculia bacterium]|nr:sigma-70 family RNA polymerase sigma factor [Thermoanaerobaculia bacterium]